MDEPGSRRGRTRNAEGARDAILDAAEQVFAQHGFDGARIDAIAAAAGYNKSLIFQYFDDKLGLYGEVIRRADDQTRSMQDEALSALHGEAALDPRQLRELLSGYVGWYFDYLVEHPRIARIYVWEMAEGWQTFAKIMSQRDFDDIDQFTPVLERLQASGLLRSDLEGILQLSTALFAATVYLAVLPLYQVLIPNANYSSPAAMQRGRMFVIDFVTRGLLIDPTEAKP
jgi:AcrR family transcriptional regulator